MTEYLVVELGRTKLSVQEIKDLEVGNFIVVETDSGHPFNVFFKGNLFATGTILTIESNFALRILKIVENSNENKTYEDNPDLPVNITVEISRIQISMQDIKELGEGSVLKIDKATTDPRENSHLPVNVFDNVKLIAKGHVIVVDTKFAVKITEIIS